MSCSGVPSADRLFLEIAEGERLPVGVADDEAFFGFRDCPGRREAASPDHGWINYYGQFYRAQLRSNSAAYRWLPSPLGAPTSRAGPSRSSRAVRDCWSVGGIAWDAALLAALQQESRYLLDEQRHPAGRSVTPSITSFGSAWRAASSPTMWRTCWRSNGES